MSFKFNPITGKLDVVLDKSQPDDGGTTPDMAKPDGYVSVAKIDGEGRVYFFVEGKRMYATGTLD